MMMLMYWLACTPASTPVEEIRVVEPSEKEPPAAVKEAGEVLLVKPQELMKKLLTPSTGGRIVNFWATWCAPCVAEMPEIQTFAKNHSEVEVLFVNVDIAKLRNKKVIPHLSRRDLFSSVTHWQLDAVDPAMELAKHVPEWPDSVPYTIFVDSKGAIAQRFTKKVSTSDLESLFEQAK